MHKHIQHGMIAQLTFTHVNLCILTVWGGILNFEY